MFLCFVAKSECDGVGSPNHMATAMNSSVQNDEESLAPRRSSAPFSVGKMHNEIL